MITLIAIQKINSPAPPHRSCARTYRFARILYSQHEHLHFGLREEIREQPVEQREHCDDSPVAIPRLETFAGGNSATTNTVPRLPAAQPIIYRAGLTSSLVDNQVIGMIP